MQTKKVSNDNVIMNPSLAQIDVRCVLKMRNVHFADTL